MSNLVAWLQEAAEEGNPDAQAVLGKMYYLGSSVPQCFSEAFVWTALAAKNGDQHALILKDKAEKQLSTAQLIAANQRVQQRFEKVHRPGASAEGLTHGQGELDSVAGRESDKRPCDTGRWKNKAP